jgi:hypothetical protein
MTTKTTLSIKLSPKTKNTIRLDYVADNLLQDANTFDFLRYNIGALVWFLLSHRGTLTKAGRDSTLAVTENNGEFVNILFSILNTLENLDGQVDLADLIDLCDGSKLSVELYYLDPTRIVSTRNLSTDYLFVYRYAFSFIGLKKTIGVHPPFTNYDLAAILTKFIEYDFVENPDLYEPFLDDPRFSLARVRLTLTFEEGKP